MVPEHTGSDVGRINKVKLRRARLVLRLVTTFGGSAIPLFSRPLSLAVSVWIGTMQF